MESRMPSEICLWAEAVRPPMRAAVMAGSRLVEMAPEKTEHSPTTGETNPLYRPKSDVASSPVNPAARNCGSAKSESTPETSETANAPMVVGRAMRSMFSRIGRAGQRLFIPQISHTFLR